MHVHHTKYSDWVISSSNQIQATECNEEAFMGEDAERSTRGLCFNCDERFTPKHRCQGPKILLLGPENDYNSQEEQDCGHEVLDEGSEFSLHALTR